MNKKQRIILIIGAAVFIYVLFTSPKVSIIKGTYVIPPPDKKDIAKIVDVRTAMTRAIAVLGATLLVSAALKNKDKPRTPSPPEMSSAAGLSEGQARSVIRDVAAKMMRFLKEFF